MPRLGGVWLLAEREFKAYVATASFWVALVLGPLLLAGAAAAVSLAAPAPITVRIVASSPQLHAAVAASLAEASRFERRSVVEQSLGDAKITLRVIQDGQTIRLASSDPATPSTTTQAFMRAAIERDLSVAALNTTGLPAPRAVWLSTEQTVADAASKLSRLGLVLMLWTTLTGSLGMLLQATVRERANRSLESLLSAASPMEIVIGKLLGIGGVSLLVLSAWLGSAFVLANFTPQSAGAAKAVMTSLADPIGLTRAFVLYGLAFGLFGMLTIAVGSIAKDAAGAQNQARPMFAVLLVVFFVCMQTVLGGGAPPAWLVYAPPLTPFLLLLQPASTATQVIAVALLLSSTLAASLWAAHGLSRGRLLPARRPKTSPETGA